jgi:cyclic pyranopterin phosphate synthase
MSILKDNFQRTIDYMRISITDRCNLRCIYCMPSEGLVPMKHRDILSYEEIVRILRIAVRIGVKKVRITGGEPLIRKNVSHLISLIKSIENIEDLSLTTNGIILAGYAQEIADAGLKRINISLDSLRADRYREMTRGGELDSVLKGIDSAEKAGLVPVKINMVPIRGFNDEEIGDFAQLTMKAPYQVRFIEFMPFGKENMWNPEYFISAEEIKSRVEKIGGLHPVRLRRSGPARYYALDGAAGVIGFISPLSNHFCGKCNRLRLTADGKLRPCLFSETEIDIKTAIRNDAPDNEIERLIKLAIQVKPEGHNMRIQDTELGKLLRDGGDYKRPMSKIGG